MSRLALFIFFFIFMISNTFKEEKFFRLIKNLYHRTWGLFAIIFHISSESLKLNLIKQSFHLEFMCYEGDIEINESINFYNFMGKNIFSSSEILFWKCRTRSRLLYSHLRSQYLLSWVPVLLPICYPVAISLLLRSMSAQKLYQPYQHLPLTTTFIYHNFKMLNLIFILLLVFLHLK